MNDAKKRKVEFGDFQTPLVLATLVCERLAELGISPDTVIEPTCGVGSFALAAAGQFREAGLRCYEINAAYLEQLTAATQVAAVSDRISIHHQDFFAIDWSAEFDASLGALLVLGNPPWVTSAGQGAIGGTNLPEKTNFLRHKGLDAITGKANFDISEWMLIELIRTLGNRGGDLAMLVKTAVARKIVAHAERMELGVRYTAMFGIDAKRYFGAAVDACLLVMRFTGEKSITGIDYDVFPSLEGVHEASRVGHRRNLTVGNLGLFERNVELVGDSPQKWRSGIKHDASSVMEFDSSGAQLTNGFGEAVNIEQDYLYPLMKGSDIGSSREWRGKFVLVTQTTPRDDTAVIQHRAPRTWSYLETHCHALDGRGSSIYKKAPRFAIFGVGDYAFRPWRIAICGLYKKLNFRLVGPIDGKPVQFDDTVYYVSFDSFLEAEAALMCIQSQSAMELYLSLIFWDEKRPIKASVLNAVDWSRVPASRNFVA